MLRECVALSVVAAGSPGCSLILDFDSALPVDAGPDAPYTQAECDYKEPNDTFEMAAPITAGDTGPAAICAPPAGGMDDRDFYKFTASGNTATIAIMFTSRPGGDVDLKLYDPGGVMIASSREFGPSETLTCPGASPSCPALTAGSEYAIEVFPGVAGSANAYTFAITP